MASDSAFKHFCNQKLYYSWKKAVSCDCMCVERASYSSHILRTHQTMSGFRPSSSSSSSQELWCNRTKADVRQTHHPPHVLGAHCDVGDRITWPAGVCVCVCVPRQTRRCRPSVFSRLHRRWAKQLWKLHLTVIIKVLTSAQGMSFQSFKWAPCRGNGLLWKQHHAGPPASVSFHIFDIALEIWMKIVKLKKLLPSPSPDLFPDYNNQQA